MNNTFPTFDGWHLVGEYDSDVGSWLLHHGGEALLLEVPEGLTVKDVELCSLALGLRLKYVTASHSHCDHLDTEVWGTSSLAFRKAHFVHPGDVQGERCLYLGGEPLWLISAPKHSPDDIVTVWRGVAMTGDIELGTLDSVTNEVPLLTRRRSLRWLQGFERRQNYYIHTVFSAHLNDVRQNVDWYDLLSVGEVACAVV